VLADGKLKELHTASGGDWGGTKVDNAFKQMLIKIFSLPVLRKFQRQYTEDYIDLFREFEVKKREITPARDLTINTRIPVVLKEIFEKETEETVPEVIKQMNFDGKMSFTGDKLKVDASVFKSFFDEAITGIVDHLEGLFMESSTHGTTAILMVGGFSESAMLQSAIKKAFPDKRLIVPEEAGLVVLKGAVVFGHHPSAIQTRVCKHTYGIELNPLFSDIHHDNHRKFESNGRFYCKDVFDKHVEIGQKLNYGEPQSDRMYAPLTSTQEHVDVVVYASSERQPTYVTDKGCTQVGKFTINVRDMSVPLSMRTLNVTLTFSGTEIEVSATERDTGKVTKSNVNFLG